MFAVKFGKFRDVAPQCQSQHDRPFNRFFVGYRGGTRKPQTHRTRPGIRYFCKVIGGAAAEHAALRFELNMDFQTDNGLVFHISYFVQ